MKRWNRKRKRKKRRRRKKNRVGRRRRVGERRRRRGGRGRGGGGRRRGRRGIGRGGGGGGRRGGGGSNSWRAVQISLVFFRNRAELRRRRRLQKLRALEAVIDEDGLSRSSDRRSPLRDRSVIERR